MLRWDSEQRFDGSAHPACGPRVTLTAGLNVGLGVAVVLTLFWPPRISSWLNSVLAANSARSLNLFQILIVQLYHSILSCVNGHPGHPTLCR